MRIRYTVLSAVLASALAAIAVAAFAAAAPSDRPSADGATEKSPLREFDRLPTDDDQYPSSVSRGLDHVSADLGAPVGESRLVAHLGPHQIYAVRVGSSHLCVIDAVSGTAALTCNTNDGFRDGFLWLGDGDEVVGLVPDEATNVRLVAKDGSQGKSNQPVRGAFIAQRNGAFGGVRFDTPGGTRTAVVPGGVPAQ
jgi:hypothetical protein